MPDGGRSISRNVAKNIMIQDMLNSENSMNTAESTNTNIFTIIKEQYGASTLSQCRKLEKRNSNMQDTLIINDILSDAFTQSA